MRFILTQWGQRGDYELPRRQVHISRAFRSLRKVQSTWSGVQSRLPRTFSRACVKRTRAYESRLVSRLGLGAPSVHQFTPAISFLTSRSAQTLWSTALYSRTRRMCMVACAIQPAHASCDWPRDCVRTYVHAYRLRMLSACTHTSTSWYICMCQLMCHARSSPSYAPCSFVARALIKFLAWTGDNYVTYYSRSSRRRGGLAAFNLFVVHVVLERCVVLPRTRVDT